MYVFGRFIHTTSTNELFVIIPTSCNPDPPMRPSVHRGPHVSSLHGWMEEEGQEIQLGKGHQRKGKDWYHLHYVWFSQFYWHFCNSNSFVILYLQKKASWTTFENIHTKSNIWPFWIQNYTLRCLAWSSFFHFSGSMVHFCITRFAWC